ncbi:MAG: GTPase HflX [Phycisphaerae bacterium]|nr:GTPase HflX [Phycisphaerae bacterium]
MEDLSRTELSVYRERAVLVGVILPGSLVDRDDPLGELESLARTAGAQVVDTVLQRRSRIDASHYIGRGKLEEIGERAEANEADVIIFDNDLSPAQIRDIEEVTHRKVIDRSELILDIFATRAQTREARLQVELAQLKYTAPRLRGMWRHLERIAGAGGATGAGMVGGIGTRGPGETQIEIDRRLVGQRLTRLKRELERIDKRRLREVKARSDQFTVSLVGYTNAGKSTLMNALTDADVKVEDKLFATLETTTRRWQLGGGQAALLSDTVGFVRDLPHHLVASFQATLEEALHADLLLHVVDASSLRAEAELLAARSVLSELGLEEAPCLLLFNKIDVVGDEALVQILENGTEDSLRISARSGLGLDKLVEFVRERMLGHRVRVTVTVDAADGRTLSQLDRLAEIHQREYDDRTVRIELSIGQADLAKLRSGGGTLAVLEPTESVSADDEGN